MGASQHTSSSSRNPMSVYKRKPRLLVHSANLSGSRKLLNSQSPTTDGHRQLRVLWTHGNEHASPWKQTCKVHGNEHAKSHVSRNKSSQEPAKSSRGLLENRTVCATTSFSRLYYIRIRSRLVEVLRTWNDTDMYFTLIKFCRQVTEHSPSSWI